MEREKIKSSIYFKWAAIVGVPMGAIVFAVLLPLFLLYGNGSMQIRIASVILAIGYLIILRISLKKFKDCYPDGNSSWLSMRIFAITVSGIVLSSFIIKSLISFEFIILTILFTTIAKIPYLDRCNYSKDFFHSIISVSKQKLDTK